MNINNRKALVWFRQDLRMHDNETLTDAIKLCDEIVPVYVFDERLFEGKTPFGFPKITRYRAKFIVESVTDLRNSLRKKGSELIVRYGKPEEIIFNFARELKTNWVFCNRERTEEEVIVQDALEKNLWSIGQEMRYYRGKMLYHTGDLPFPVTHTPDTFAQFRKEVEKFVPVREPHVVPEKITTYLRNIEAGEIPGLQELGFSDFDIDERAAYEFKGGESEGIERLEEFIWENEAITEFKAGNTPLNKADYSSKFSPYLAQGCLSPKRIYEETIKFEKEKIANDSTNRLKSELLWRDFFRFMAKKHGNKIFQLGGYKEKIDPEWHEDWEKFNKWKSGMTGIPFLDANMRELNHTGFMTDRGRQNVSSFLINDLKLNWLMGAEYFESLLIDYDPASNYGNWCYLAGVGSDPQDNRYLNFLAQAQRYDPDGEYVKTWIPELKDVPADKVHQPYLIDEEDEKKYEINIGDDYPLPMIEMKK